MPLNTQIVKGFDTYATAVVDGEKLGPFDSWSRPGRSGNTQEYWPGGASRSVRTRGRPSTDTGTLVITVKSAAELAPYRRVWRKAGVAPMSVTEITLNADGDPVDRATWQGLLEDVEFSDADSDSTDNQTVTLTFAPDGEVA